MPSQIGGGGEERQSAEPIFDPFLIRDYFWPLPPYCAGGPSVTLQTVSSNVAVPPPLGKPLDNYFTLHLLLPLPLILPAALFPLCVHLLYFYLSSGHHCSSMHWMIGSSTIQISDPTVQQQSVRGVNWVYWGRSVMNPRHRDALGGGTCPVSVGHDPPHPQPPSAMNSAAPLQYVPHGVGWTLWSARAATIFCNLQSTLIHFNIVCGRRLEKMFPKKEVGKVYPFDTQKSVPPPMH